MRALWVNVGDQVAEELSENGGFRDARMGTLRCEHVLAMCQLEPAKQVRKSDVASDPSSLVVHVFVFPCPVTFKP
jgi:hypothetical protein